MNKMNDVFTELSRLIGRPVGPDSDIFNNEQLWDKLTPEQKKAVGALLVLAMSSPDIMFPETNSSSKTARPDQKQEDDAVPLRLEAMLF